MDPLYLILAVSVLGPLLGSLIGIIHRPSESFMKDLLAFSAGVMLGISFMQLIPKSIELSSVWVCVSGLIFGLVFMLILDNIIPHIHPRMCQNEHGARIEKTAFLIAVGIFLHNFPEGMAIALGSVTTFHVSLTIALALAVHDIPEGICTSAPYYYITKNRWKAFLISAITVIPTVIGFLLAHWIFPNIPIYFVALIIAITAGVMIYVSADELIPGSCDKQSGTMTHNAIVALTFGIISVIMLGLL